MFQNCTSDEISITKRSQLVPCLNEDKLPVWLTPLLDAQTRSSSLKFFSLSQPVLFDCDSASKSRSEKRLNERKNQTQLFEVRSQVRGSSAHLSCLATFALRSPPSRLIKALYWQAESSPVSPASHKVDSIVERPPLLLPIMLKNQISESCWPRLHAHLM